MLREPYLRGRALLAGQRWDAFSFADRVNFAEAALLEPALHGAFTSVDELLDKVADVIAESSHNPDTFGTSPGAQRAAEAAEAAFPQAAPRTASPPEQPPEP